MKRSQLERKSPLARNTGLDRRKPMKQGRGFAASRAQREKVKDRPCVVCGGTTVFPAHHLCGPVQPAHVCARAQGGCDAAECVVPLCQGDHYLYDLGELDLLPYLVQRHVPELQHALGHYNGDLIALLQRLTGQRWRPDEKRKAA